MLLETLLLGLTLTSASADPYRLTDPEREKNVIAIIENAHKYNADMFEILAIAITESFLNPAASSHTGDYGLMQINCRVWWEFFNFKSKKDCAATLTSDVERNIEIAIQILNLYKDKYSHCKRNMAYFCYNGGAGWPNSENKDKILHYGKVVKERKWYIKRRYKEFLKMYQMIVENPHIYDIKRKRCFDTYEDNICHTSSI